MIDPAYRCKTWFQILDQIEENGISIYPLPDCDEDEDEDYKEQCRQLKVSHTQLSTTPI